MSFSINQINKLYNIHELNEILFKIILKNSNFLIFKY